MTKIKLLTPILGLAAIVAPLTITSCSCGGKTPVDPVKPTGITINPDSLDLTVSQTKQLTAKVSPTDASQEVTWTSSNGNIATVDANGNVKGISKGNVTITAKPKGYDIPAVCVVNVYDAGDSKFVCEQSQQTTERGQTVCWYIFNFEGGEEIPADLDITFDKEYEELNSQILWQIVPETDNKQLKVGIQGLSKFLESDQTINFMFVFKSEALGLNQSTDCSYTYLKSMIRADGARSANESDGAVEVFETFSFELTDGKKLGEREIDATLINITKTESLNIKTPTIDLSGESTEDLMASVKFEIDDGEFVANQWINFDIQFEDKKNGWTQVIKNYHFNITPVSWTQYSFNKQTEVVIDWKGDKQNALKVVDDNDKGILPKGTSVGTPFEIHFDLSTWPEAWYQPNQWKFGSYKHPTETHVEYYYFSSISVWIDNGGSDLIQLPQTEPADHEGVNGLWWESSGGPITVLYNKVKDEYPDVQKIVYRLRTADAIEFDSSFYVTYA